MLKYGQSFFINRLTRMFNPVLPHGYYPQALSFYYITPLHKGDSIYNTEIITAVLLGWKIV